MSAAWNEDNSTLKITWEVEAEIRERWREVKKRRRGGARRGGER